jgi:DNA-binding transcriptional regulator YiaG
MTAPATPAARPSPTRAPIPGAGQPWSGQLHPQRGGNPAGSDWHAGPDDRLSGHQAVRAASLLERAGWRAEAVPLAQGVAKVEVRALAVRGMPLVAALRTCAEVDAFLRAYPGERPPGPRLSAAEWGQISARGARRFARELAATRAQVAEPSAIPGTDEPAPAEVRAMRHALGLSQRQLARRLAVSRSYLADVERGRWRGPDAAALLRRAVVLLRQLEPPHMGRGQVPRPEGASR